MSDPTGTIYNDRNNILSFLLKEDGTATDLTNATKIDLIFKGVKNVTDSTAANYPIKWSGTAATGQIDLKLGDQEITAGNYQARLVVYDATNTDGITWGEISMTVSDKYSVT